MVRNERKSALGRLLWSGSEHKSGASEQTLRAEEKMHGASDAIEQWLSLLRELERDGESGDARYDTYYRAYLQAREQEKRAELELFNLQQGLTR
ncbi:MAG TPA: hypothetical protein DEV93_20035 [Chloroflexi bacterium]|nr:hypothetical protein [Chloroflexota bacterium]